MLGIEFDWSPPGKIEFYGLYELEGGEEDFIYPVKRNELEDWIKFRKLNSTWYN